MSIEEIALGHGWKRIQNRRVGRLVVRRLADGDKKSMNRQLLLGSAAGLVGGLMSWRGNQEPHLVSTFPDLVTFLVFMVLVTSVVWLELSRQAASNRSAALRTGAVVGSAAGVVFGVVMILLGVVQFTRPVVGLLSFSFLGAFVLAVMFGLFAAFAWSLTQRRAA